MSDWDSLSEAAQEYSACHRKSRMVSGHGPRSLLPLVLNRGNIVPASDTDFRPAVDVCDEFYDTLQEYYEPAMRVVEATVRTEEQLREDVEAGWLSPRQADVILAGIVASDDEHANWPWKRWKEARRIRDHAPDDSQEWTGADGLADRLDEYFDEFDS